MEFDPQAYSNTVVSLEAFCCLRDRLLFPVLEFLFFVIEGMPKTGSAFEFLVHWARDVHLHLLLHCANAAPTLIVTPTAPLAAAICGAGSVDDLASASCG